VIWQNTTTAVQDATSDDGGQTFTTGPIQPAQNSLPIAFLDPAVHRESLPQNIPYSSTASGLTGLLIVSISAS
jgi:hypothetical protein